jgi:hypothetical protein
LFDEFPEYEFDVGSSVYTEKSRNDAREFLTRHYGHEMEELRTEGEKFVDGNSFRNPFKDVYYNVTNGTDQFIVKKHRTSIDSPVSYMINPGSFRIIIEPPSFDSEKFSLLVSHFEWGNQFLAEHENELGSALEEILGTIKEHGLDRRWTLWQGPGVEIMTLPEKLFLQFLEILERLVGRELPQETVDFLKEQNAPGGGLQIILHKKIEILPDNHVKVLDRPM